MEDVGRVAQGRPCLVAAPRLHSVPALPPAEPSPSCPGAVTGLEKAPVGCLAFSLFGPLLGLELLVIWRH